MRSKIHLTILSTLALTTTSFTVSHDSVISCRSSTNNNNDRKQDQLPKLNDISKNKFDAGKKCISNLLLFSSLEEGDDEFEPTKAQLEWLEKRKETNEQINAVTKDQPDTNEKRGNVFLPSTGVSVSDEIMESQNGKLRSKVIPFDGKAGVARILSSSAESTNEPIRYLVSLSPPRMEKSNESSNEMDGDGSKSESSNHEGDILKYALVDIPPYSDELVEQMHNFMGPNSKLSSILVTSRTSIHYEEGPAVYVTRKSELETWIKAFPGVEVVMYRLDTPRDCRDLVTQKLDGYGPWALEEGVNGEENAFIETGRPLTYIEWDEETKVKVLDDGESPPDDDDIDEEEDYSPLAIRKKEEGKRILAVYTPGHTYGSVSFIFPEMGVCCSGFTIPVESSREAANMGIRGAGPTLDYRGYVTTNTAGISKQMESARHLVNNYCDRFDTVLSSKSCFVSLSDSEGQRKSLLLDVILQFEQVGKIYEEMGIIDG